MTDKTIFKVEDGKYSIFGNTYGNGQFSLIYSDDLSQVRIKSTSGEIHPIDWELITSIGDGQGGFYADKADLENRGLPGFTESGGGLSGVESVTGESVDNTDPKNPIVRDKVYILGGSIDTMVITNNTNSPSYMTGFVISKSRGFELEDQATGTFRNVSGRDILSMVGTISFHPTETGGGTGVLQLMSERSIDGINWASNLNSLRTIEVSSNGESFATKVSYIIDVLDGERFRFRLVETGSGGITLLSTNETIMGDVITSPSAAFAITEQ